MVWSPAVAILVAPKGFGAAACLSARHVHHSWTPKLLLKKLRLLRIQAAFTGSRVPYVLGLALRWGRRASAVCACLHLGRQKRCLIPRKSSNAYENRVKYVLGGKGAEMRLWGKPFLTTVDCPKRRNYHVKLDMYVIVSSGVLFVSDPEI